MNITHRFNLKFIILALLTAITTTPAFAVGSSGFENAALSTSSLGRGNASVADPKDASILAFNAAGLAQLDRNEVYTGVNLVVPRFRYEGVEGRSSEVSSETLIPVPFAYTTLNLPIEGLVVGLGANSPFGTISKWSSTGSFPYIADFTELTTKAYHISLGYQLTPNLAIGAGWTHMDSGLKQVGKFHRNLVAGSTDAPFEYDVDGEGQGWNASLLWDVNETDKLGVNFRSEVRLHYKGTMNTHGLTGGLAAVFGGSSNITSADADTTVPASITIGYSRQVNDKLNLEVDFGYTFWSSYDSFDTVFGTSNAVLVGFEHLDKDYDNALSIHVGGTYEYNDFIDLSAGYFFFEMAANELNYTNEVPDGHRHSFNFGLEYDANGYTYGLTYHYQIFGERDINNLSASTNGPSDIDGKYSSDIHLLSLGVRRPF